MASKSGSNNDDLMLGAGKFYFYDWKEGVPQRDDLYFLGNAEEGNLTTDVTTVEKNSSMDHNRELMASAVTAVKPSLTLKCNEFDPVNLARGLYGSTGIFAQAEATLTKTVNVSPDSNIRLINEATGQAYYNVTDVSIAAASPSASSISAATKSTTLGSDGVITTSGTYTGTSNEVYYIKIVTANTTAGSVTGAEFQWVAGSLTGTYSANMTATGLAQTLSNGVAVALNCTGTQNFIVGEIYKVNATASGTVTYTADKDYVVDEVDIRGGVINIPETSTIPAGTAVIVNFKVPEGAYPKIIGGKNDVRYVGIVFFGDPNIGPCYNGEFWKCKLVPNGDTGFIGTDFGSYTIKADILADKRNHPKEPMYTLTKVR